jgi:hypothetical protein
MGENKGQMARWESGKEGEKDKPREKCTHRKCEKEKCTGRKKEWVRDRVRKIDIIECFGRAMYY